MSKYYYDEVSAERPILWIEKYCTSTTGKPFKLLEYQKRDIIRPMFGWKNQDGTFRYRFCYIEIGKGNGKSGLLSALATYLCFAAGEVNAEIYAIANDRKQAGIVHEDIKKIVRANPVLMKKTAVLRDTILYEDRGKAKGLNFCTPSYHNLQITQLKWLNKRVKSSDIQQVVENWEAGFNSFFMRFFALFGKSYFRFNNKAQR
jgi:hypothetical protein